MIFGAASSSDTKIAKSPSHCPFNVTVLRRDALLVPSEEKRRENGKKGRENGEIEKSLTRGGRWEGASVPAAYPTCFLFPSTLLPSLLTLSFPLSPFPSLPFKRRKRLLKRKEFLSLPPPPPPPIYQGDCSQDKRMYESCVVPLPTPPGGSWYEHCPGCGDIRRGSGRGWRERLRSRGTSC